MLFLREIMRLDLKYGELVLSLDEVSAEINVLVDMWSLLKYKDSRLV